MIADPAGTRALNACGRTIAFRSPGPGACQEWRFVHAGDGFYRVVSGTGRALFGELRIETTRLVSRDGTALPSSLDTP